MVFGMILAGGVGSRMGSNDKPKQYLMLRNKPVIVHTIEKFLLYDGFEKIIVLCPESWTDYTEKIIKEYIDKIKCKDIIVLIGGMTRNETIMNGIAYIENEYGKYKDTLIVTHDAARPFINKRIISENIDYAKKYGAATTAVCSTDTILVAGKEKFVKDIPNRSFMYQCQTPQTFYAQKLKELYNSLSEKERKILTDASKIFLLKENDVAIVEGERYNIKLTYPEDMAVAEAYIDLLA